ncbi:Uncharacterised protein [Actinobaculum suis]|uniref:DUF8094 domain-containing protein n=1 Tax=Actinobaculum suis TaxID=1657 RepID=A0A7Z8YA28_9ACTO|nr:hypothetical protein [Actinobaculum suis]VDG77044.1 Uncharacterised protein [Actinobaculum suis]
MRKIIAVLCAGLLGLTGCSKQAEIPQPQPVVKPERAALSETHFAEVRTSINETLAAADEKLDAKLLATRAYSPFREDREARYRVKNVLKDAYNLPALSSEPQSDKVSAVSRADGFPRYAVVAMQPPADSSLPVVTVYTQPSARENWGVWSSMSIMPGATIPALPAGSQGAEVIAPDDGAGLVASPQQVASAYANLLTFGDSQGLKIAASADSPDTPDTFRAGINTELESLRTAFEGSGEASYSFAPSKVAPMALRDAEGGALTVVPINYTMNIKITKEGAKITLEDQRITAAATGQPGQSIAVDGEMRVNFSAQLAFRIPPEGTENPVISVIAASQPLVTSVENGAPAA